MEHHPERLAPLLGVPGSPRIVHRLAPRRARRTGPRRPLGWLVRSREWPDGSSSMRPGRRSRSPGGGESGPRRRGRTLPPGSRQPPSAGPEPQTGRAARLIPAPTRRSWSPAFTCRRIWETGRGEEESPTGAAFLGRGRRIGRRPPRQPDLAGERSCPPQPAWPWRLRSAQPELHLHLVGMSSQPGELGQHAVRYRPDRVKGVLEALLRPLDGSPILRGRGSPPGCRQRWPRVREPRLRHPLETRLSSPGRSGTKP